ncbi:DUF1549 and DUF1553 domain-containing protein [Isosphaeraceae bacterium EP7]
MRPSRHPRWLLGLAGFALAWGVVCPEADAQSGRGRARAKPPASAKAKEAGPEDEIDRMIREAWDESKIKPSRVAPDSEFMRRAYLDLLGRIPNIREATAFLESKEPAKRAKLVDYLLEHPDYAQNFANQWSVLLIGRNRQERTVDRVALKTWLRRQFAENKPWNEVARELIVAKGSNKQNGAVNFTLAHLEFEKVPLTSITTRVFLGQQIQCTQCHDHPSNDWKQADFWGINAFFKGLKPPKPIPRTDENGATVEDEYELIEERTDAYSTFERRNAEIRIVFPTFLDGKKISQDADVDRRESLGNFITDKSNRDFSKAFVNRIWGHLMGRGFVHPLDDFGPHNPPSHPELLDKLGDEFIAGGYDIKALIRRIASTQTYNLTSATIPNNEKDETLFSHMTLKPMNPEQLFDSLLMATSAQKAGGTGDNDRLRADWYRQFEFAFSTDEGDEGSSFQGTIPQALMMMNGDLMAKAVGGKSGSFLGDLKERAALQNEASADAYIVNQLYLAALGRTPTPKEMSMGRGFLGNFPDTIAVMEDMFWALLNSNEFILNR